MHHIYLRLRNSALMQINEGPTAIPDHRARPDQSGGWRRTAVGGQQLEDLPAQAAEFDSLHLKARPCLSVCPCLSPSARLGGQIIKIDPHCILNPAKPVAAQLFAAIPPCNNDDMIAKLCALKHPQDHHGSAAFAIIRL